MSVLDSDLTSNGAVTLRAASSADARALATSLASHSDPRLDAATAAVVLASSAVSRIGGAGSVHAGGTLFLLASNLANASAVADASGSTAGAAIATLDVERTTRAVIEGPAGSVVAGGLDVVASSGGSLDVRAVGSAEGATLNGIAPGTLTGGLARTTQGLLPVASALGLGRLRGATEAALGGAGGLSVSSQNGVRVEGVTAGGLQVRADGSRTDGPGATAALALAGLTTRAALAGDLALTAPTVRVDADSTDLRTGARASARNAAADALSVTAAQIGTIADIAPGAALVLSAPADVVLRSRSKSSSSAGTDGAAAGLAVLLVDHVGRSRVGTDAVVDGARNLTISASSTDDATGTVEGGRGRGSAVVVSNVTTESLLDAGPALFLTGDLDVSALQDADARAAAPQVALVFAQHRVRATSARGLDVAGAARFAATGGSRVSSHTAPLATTPLLAASTAVANGRAVIDSIAAALGLRPSSGPAVPSTGGIRVQSVAVAVATAAVSATLPEGLGIRVVGPLDVPATAAASSVASAGGGSGSATGPSFALNLATSDVLALLSREARVTGDLTVRASRGPPAEDRSRKRTDPRLTGPRPDDPHQHHHRPRHHHRLHAEAGILAACGCGPRLGSSRRHGPPRHRHPEVRPGFPGARRLDPRHLQQSLHRRVARPLRLFDLRAYDATTGAELHTFLVDPVLSVAADALPGSGLWYLDPVTGPVRVASASTGGSVTAVLPHFSEYVVALDGADLLAAIALVFADFADGTPPTR